MVERMEDDDVLMSLLEQAEIVTRAWADTLSFSEISASAACISPDVLKMYASGVAGPEQDLAIAAHLGECRNCRKATIRWRTLQDAEQGVGTCSLKVLRKIMEEDPDSATRSFVRISRQISDMVDPLPPEEESGRYIEASLLGAKGEPSGESLHLTLDRHPFIDFRYFLRLPVRTEDPAGEGCRLRVTLKDSRGKIEVGTVALAKGSTTAGVDLSDLRISPGFLRMESLEIFAERLEYKVGHPTASGVKTSPRVERRLSPEEMIGRTMTEEQLADVRVAKQRPKSGKPVSQKNAPKGSAGRHKLHGGDEGE